MTSIDELRNMRSPMTVVRYLVTDHMLAEELKRTRIELRHARASNRVMDTEENRRKIADLEAKVSEMKDSIHESSIKFVFAALGQKKYEELVRRHRPSEARRKVIAEETGDKEGAAALWFDPDTFPTELIARSLIEPEMTDPLDDVIDFFKSDHFNGSEIGYLFDGALMANTQRTTVDLGKD